MNVYIFCSLCVLPLLDLSLGAAIRRNGFSTRNEQMQYLERYGYLDAVRGGSSGRQSSSRRRGSEVEAAAVRLFQRKAHIPETGVMDAETIRMMNKPRCGVPDFPTRGGRGPIQFNLQGSTWNDSNISYRIKKFTSKLPVGGQASAIHQAFAMWSSVAPLTFTHSQTSAVDIDISFEKGEHGDDIPLVKNEVLAHAFFPQYGGDIHFNDHHSWSLNEYEGTDLFQVALHEIGHSLGLDHSDDKGAIMYWSYKEGLHPVKLHPDDIDGIQHLYPRNRVDPATTTNPTTTTTTNPTTTAPPPGTATYNCDNNSPCTPEKTSGGQYYFPHDNRHKYVQCDNWGQCWDRDCGATLVWNPVAYTCTRR